MKKLLASILLAAFFAANASAIPLVILHRGRTGSVGGGGGGGFAQVQLNTYNSSTANATHSITYGATPTSGNLLVLGVVSGGTIATPPSGWTVVTPSPEAASVGLYCYYKVAGSSEPTTVSFTQSAAAAMCISAFEYSGMNTSSPVDQSAVNTTVGGTASSVSTGTTATTTNATDLLFCVAGAPGDQGAANDGLCSFSSWSAGYTTQSTMKSTGTVPTFGGVSGSVGTQSVTSTGAYSATATWNTTTGNPEALIVAFKKS